MPRVDCPHEADVLMMVTTGRWPDRAPEELRAHASTCDICADIALIAQVIDDDAAMMPAPPLPSAGTVWWRAQLRARQEAAKDVGRPITVAQGVLLAVVGGVAGAVFGATTGWFQRVLSRVWGGVSDAASSATASIHFPSLPALPSDVSVLADYRTGLIIVGVGVALAMAVVVWGLREE